MARGTDGLLAFLELARLSEKWPQVRGFQKMESLGAIGILQDGAPEAYY